MIDWSAGFARCAKHKTYLIRDAATHARSHDDTAFDPEAFHLPSCSLCSEEYTVYVDVNELRNALVRTVQLKPDILHGPF